MLIAFEGLDQSGKQTQAEHLRNRLVAAGRTVHAVSFPDYATPIGREIRLALDGERAFGADVMQLLYVANRFEYRDRLERWLAADGVVVCDRYRASSVAYGEAQGLDPIWLEEIQRHLPPADLTILLDIAPERAARRKAGNRDLYERDLALLSRVRESYQRQAAAPGWVIVNADRDKAAVATTVAEAIDAVIGDRDQPR